jgi:DNA (cytosine-5)-methyltransferase 1
MTLQLVSLFAGVGGFDIAAERAGIDPVVACEIDPQARGVLQHRFPKTTLINDVKEVTGERLTALGLDPKRTIITGGFPCQDLSIAGKQAGLEGGERSSLFFEIVRILREFNPQWFILENVPGLLSSKGGRDMGIVIGSLAELGYSFSWRILDAQKFGVPQRRRRVFIVGHFGADETRAEKVLFESEGSGRNLDASQPQRQDTTGNIADSVKPNSQWPPLISPTVTSKWHKGTGGPSGDEYQNLVPFVKSRRAQTDQDVETWIESEVTPTLNRIDNTGESYATVLIHNKQSDGDVRLYDDVSPTVTRTWGTGGNNVPMIETKAYSIREDAKANNFSATEIKTARALQALQPSVQSHHAQTFIAEPPTTVRRLTPMECERLQGFPDGWSAQRVDHKKGVVVDQADSSRYKQMGNAVAVPVVEWIFNRLVLSQETV